MNQWPPPGRSRIHIPAIIACLSGLLAIVGAIVAVTWGLIWMARQFL